MEKLTLKSSQHSLTDQLLRQLNQGKVSERVEALSSLAKLNDPEIVPILLSQLTDKSPQVRAAASEYLGLAGDSKAIKPLVKRLNDNNSEVRRAAISSLGFLLVGQKSPRVLMEKLGDRNMLVRIETCETLGAIGDKKALPALLRALYDSSPLVRSYAAGAIGELGGQKEIGSLEERLKVEKSETAKVGIYQALYQLGRQNILPALISMLRSKDYRVRCATANILSKVVANEKTSPIILDALHGALRREPTLAGRDAIESSVRYLNNEASA